jgi:hypothetical protein
VRHLRISPFFSAMRAAENFLFTSFACNFPLLEPLVIHRFLSAKNPVSLRCFFSQISRGNPNEWGNECGFGKQISRKGNFHSGTPTSAANQPSAIGSIILPDCNGKTNPPLSPFRKGGKRGIFFYSLHSGTFFT